MSKSQLLQKLVNTKFTENSKEVISRIVRKEFDATNDEDKAFELMQIAFKENLPCLNSMLDDYSLTDFNFL